MVLLRVLSFLTKHDKIFKINISEFKNVTIPDNTNVHSRHGVYATNLALGNNSCLAIDFNEVGCVNYNGTATSSFAITSNNQYAGVSIKGTINAPIVNVYAANVLIISPLLAQNVVTILGFNVFKFFIGGNDIKYIFNASMPANVTPIVNTANIENPFIK